MKLNPYIADVHNQKQIFVEIIRERRFQDEKWGKEFDKLNSPNDWVAYIAAYLGAAVTMPWNIVVFRTAILKVAALCVAILERTDYAPRHYDATQTVATK